AVPLLTGHPDGDAVLVDDKRGADRGIGGIVREAARLGRGRFDLAVAPHRSLRTAVVLAAARIPRRVAVAATRGAFLYGERVPRDRTLHDVQRNLALLAPFGGSNGESRLHVAVQPDAARRAAALVPDGSGPLVGIAPGSVWAAKRWTAAGFAAVGRALRPEGAPVVRPVGRAHG